MQTQNTRRFARLVRSTVAGIALFGAIGTSVTFGAAPDKIRVVDCDEQVQSKKRGICANDLSADDFRAIAPGVSWFYNWHFETKDTPPSDAKVEFVPMLWGNTQERLSGLERYLAAGHKPRAVLSINEPNLKGQAFITPEETAALYMKGKAIADKYGIPTVGPHMALGSAANESIKAMDPIEKKEVTYTFMVPFLKAFLTYLDPNDVSATAFHAYGNMGEMRWAVGMMAKDFNRPVWVTEYAQWNVPNEAAGLRYLIESTDFLERHPSVPGYAWFKERVGNNPKISLFTKKSGELTALGKAYVKLPVHDEDVYYRIPGKLPAANYVKLDKAEIQPTSDKGGFVEMYSQDGGAWLDYNVQVAKAGTYVLTFRTSDATGEIVLQSDGKELAAVSSNEKQWHDVGAKVELKKGAQTLRIGLREKGQNLHWIEFAGN